MLNVEPKSCIREYGIRWCDAAAEQLIVCSNADCRSRLCRSREWISDFYRLRKRWPRKSSPVTPTESVRLLCDFATKPQLLWSWSREIGILNNKVWVLNCFNSCSMMHSLMHDLGECWILNCSVSRLKPVFVSIRDNSCPFVYKKIRPHGNGARNQN